MSTIAEENTAIENCEKAVLHEIELIQPFGYLLACDVDSWKVTHASENLIEWFDTPATEILGRPLDHFLSEPILHQCRNAIGHSTINSQRESVGRLEKLGKSYDIFVHKKQQQLIIELQAASDNPQAGLKMMDTVQRILKRLGKYQSTNELMAAAVDELRAFSGFHRVKTYRFLSDGAGEVISESREPQVASFLGLRFPAFDIPQAARALYASTPIRVIPSVEATQILIVTEKNQRPLDLSLALFRGVVPVHLLYLKNMGVKATLSLPIIVNGVMWGLFACHHYDDKRPDSEGLTSLEILGHSISMMLATLLQREQFKRLEECNRLINSLFKLDKSALGFTAYWRTSSPELAKLINCDGLVLVGSKQIDDYGLCPEATIIKQLADAFDHDELLRRQPDQPIAIDSIRNRYPEINSDKIAGVLVIPKPAPTYRYLLFFRQIASEKIHWAGAPQKIVEKRDNEFHLNPRASFADYIDANQQHSDAFEPSDLTVASALKEALDSMMSADSTHHQHRERMGLMIRELNHRVRNILALVSSIVSQSQSSSHDLESFVIGLEKRIQTLSEAQKLLTEFDWQPIRIRLLLERVLNPHQVFLQNRFTLDGDDIALQPELASLLALITHELTSNAIKYGALANDSGTIHFSWIADAHRITLQWQEKGGRPVVEPSHQGFGTTLIKEALAYEFDASCDLHFLSEGVKATFVIPLTNISLQTKSSSQQTDQISADHEGFTALILEDDYVIANDSAVLLKSLGAGVVDVTPTIARAKACIANKRYDFALLDANIRNEFSGEVATILEKQNIPFAFATGYGSKDQVLNTTACLAVMAKPIMTNELLSVLRQANVIENDQA